MPSLLKCVVTNGVVVQSGAEPENNYEGGQVLIDRLLEGQILKFSSNICVYIIEVHQA